MTYKSQQIFISQQILKAHENYGFTSFMIVGSQGTGKTTLALKAMFQVYGDWSKVIDYTFLEPEELMDVLRERFEEGERVPAILVDDVAVGFDKYSWASKQSKTFAKLFNLMRTISSGAIFTSVEGSDLFKWVRDKIQYEVWVRRLTKEESEYRIYRRLYYPGNPHPYVKLKVIGRLTLDGIPDWVRKHYEEKRREAISYIFRQLEEEESGEVLKNRNLLDLIP